MRAPAHLCAIVRQDGLLSHNTVSLPAAHAWPDRSRTHGLSGYASRSCRLRVHGLTGYMSMALLAVGLWACRLTACVCP